MSEIDLNQYFVHPLGLNAPKAAGFITTYSGHGYTPLDIATSDNYRDRLGTPIYAMCDGEVTNVHYNHGSTQYDTSYAGGNDITILAENTLSQSSGILNGDLIIYHCHLVNPSEYPQFPTLHIGDKVKKGQLIGGMGCSGHTEGSEWFDGPVGQYVHLHLDIKPLIRTGTAAYAEYSNKTCAGQAVGDRLGYAIFSQEPVYIKIQGSSDTPPPGGIEYDPTSCNNAMGGTMVPEYGNSYGSLSMSENFMGAYPDSLTTLSNNPGLKMAYLICTHEFGEGEEGISYAKLLRATILYRSPTDYQTAYNYRAEGSTLETFCRWWQERGWGSYNVITESQQKSDWDLEKAQTIYKNIRYGPAYGLTQAHTIEGFQACPFQNNHSGPTPVPGEATIINLATVVEFLPGLYYTIFTTNWDMDQTRREPNPAVIPNEDTHTHEERDGCHYFDGLIVVNKSYPMTQAAISAVGGLRSETIAAYNNLKAGWEAYASQHNIRNEPMSVSGGSLYGTGGYRSYSDQQSIYNSYPSSTRDTYSARPGYSEHHTGYAIDITSASSDSQTGYVARYPNQSAWLAQHCHEYGFIIRYPYGKDSITGYIYEPWHVRYVGTKWANKLKNTTIEEYFGITSQY